MAYTNKKSAKRKHKKYRRRTKKGGVLMFVRKPVNSLAIRRNESVNREVDDSEAIRDVATDYTRAALEDAVAIFSRKAQEQALAPAQAPQLIVTVHGKSRAKRQGLTPGQIKKEQEKELAKQLKETKKALAKQQKEAEKAAKKAAKEEEKAAKEVTRAGIEHALSTMFDQHYKARG